ncbi:uncharacterized protein LOC125523354 [Triticum urartu]|uniref:uncharacterized protein LOC125523354 n=1 Tax=Triticum urartu TaxID=4572 RepID=UPI002043421E|nr:uncharacterized protein LOC125523354 [Triticum urartu]
MPPLIRCRDLCSAAPAPTAGTKTKPRSCLLPTVSGRLPARPHAGCAVSCNLKIRPDHLALPISSHSHPRSTYTLATSLPSDLVSPISPAKMSTVTRAYLDQRLAAAKRCSKEAAMAGAKAAAVATVAAAVPTLASVRMLPWVRAHLNPTGQALIISTVAGMAYFIVADKTILSMARKHSHEMAPEHLKNTSFH